MAQEDSTVIGIDGDILMKLFGNFDENLKLIEELTKVNIITENDSLVLIGETEYRKKAEELIFLLIALIKDGAEITKAKVRQSFDLIDGGKSEQALLLNRDVVAVTSRGKQIKCKTLGQRDYVRAIKKNTVVFGIGPAGTGKTYLAVALAVNAYKSGEAERIILTRPAIEAGEKLGFLPGDLQTKVDPYLRPLYDALEEMFGIDSYLKLIERGIIELAPLAYMRGRTLSGAFIILDEAQNTTREQMQMFLTRLGEGSKMVITGDLTQIDLPIGKLSGLKQARDILGGIDGIAICELTDKDIVRHELVQKIVQAYAKGAKDNEHQ